jgi:hypothetical protein
MPTRPRARRGRCDRSGTSGCLRSQNGLLWRSRSWLHAPTRVPRVSRGTNGRSWDRVSTDELLRGAQLPRRRRRQRSLPALARRGGTRAALPGRRDAHGRRGALERAASLLPLPAHPFESDLLRVVSSGKTPYVRFDRNLYSIPHELVRRALTRVASDVTVRLLDGQREVARHARSYGTPRSPKIPPRGARAP